MERGRLRIYLGAAPGVGKTYAMLNEARRRRERGADVVVGLVETHGRQMTADQVGDLEVIPRREVEYRGVVLTELDVDAVLARRPSIVAVDEYAHTNAPGSVNEKRWQDVETILAAGIDVITTVNIQHLESLNDVVAEIVGVKQIETVPDRYVRQADQIELVDMSPEALRRRMAHGNIYPPDRATAALTHFFRPGNLGALRELALLWVADRVEEHLGDYLHEQGITATWETRERVLVGISGSEDGDTIVRRAARVAGRNGGDLIGVHVTTSDVRRTRGTDTVERQFQLLESLGGSRREVVGDDPVAALLDVARADHATQIVIGATRRTGWRTIGRPTFASRLSAQEQDIDVHIVGHDRAQRTEAVDSASGADRADRDHRPRVALDPDAQTTARSLDPQEITGPPANALPTVRTSRPRRHDIQRLWPATALLAVGLVVLTAALTAVGDRLSLTSALLLFLVLVVSVAAIGGRAIAAVGALTSALAVNFFFVEPRYTLAVADADNLLALGVFLVVGLVVGNLVDRIGAQATEAATNRAEAAILARAATVLVADPDPVNGLLQTARETFRLSGARLVQTEVGKPPNVLAETGTRTTPELSIAVDEPASPIHRQLVVGGRHLGGGDQRVLTALAQQLVVAIDRQTMHRDATRAMELAAVDETRTTLLRAVSHDLRTPLATIKALSSGLLDQSVEWSREQLAEMHETIDQEADRLNRLIGNLLDASRLESGVLGVTLDEVQIDDVVDAALRSLTHRPPNIHLDIPHTLPAACGDRALLERAIANLLDNARRYSPPTEPVSVTAGQFGNKIHVCVIDRGAGIPLERRSAVTAPFQRLNDTSKDGVGLGLSIVEGFVRAMHGSLLLDDTPGGGLTATIELPAAPELLAAPELS